ncbi:hypothetical protein PS15m_001978 [Mucor circinelloides]
MKQYYLHQFTIYRMNMNQRALTLQSRNAALVATREESLYLEDEMIVRIETEVKRDNMKRLKQQMKKIARKNMDV